MLTLPDGLIEVARKRSNSRPNSDGSQSTFRSVYLRDPGSYAPGIEVSVEEEVFGAIPDVEGGVLGRGTLFVEPRSLKAISGRTQNPYDATVPRLRLVSFAPEAKSALKAA